MLYHGHINNVSLFWPKTKTSFKAAASPKGEIDFNFGPLNRWIHRVFKKASVRRRRRHQFSPAHLCCQHSHSPQPQPCDGDDWQVMEVCWTKVFASLHAQCGGNLNSSHMLLHFNFLLGAKLLALVNWLQFHFGASNPIWFFLPHPSFEFVAPHKATKDLQVFRRRVFKHFQFLGAAAHQNPSSIRLGTRLQAEKVTRLTWWQLPHLPNTSWRFRKVKITLEGPKDHQGWLEDIFKSSPSYSYTNQSDLVIGRHSLNKFDWNIEKHFASQTKRNMLHLPVRMREYDAGLIV